MAYMKNYTNMNKGFHSKISEPTAGAESSPAVTQLDTNDIYSLMILCKNNGWSGRQGVINQASTAYIQLRVGYDCLTKYASKKKNIKAIFSYFFVCGVQTGCIFVCKNALPAIVRAVFRNTSYSGAYVFVVIKLDSRS